MVTCLHVSAQSPLDSLQAFLENTQTIKSHFTQSKHHSFLKNEITTKGTFYYKKPAQMKWQQDFPTPHTLILNNGALLIKEGSKNRSIDTRKTKMGTRMHEMMMSMVNGGILNNENFTRDITYSDTSIVIRLVGKVKGTGINEIILNFSRSDFYLQSLKIVEDNGDFSMVHFSQHRINESLGDEIFLTNASNADQ